MTIEMIIDLLQKQIGLRSAEYSLAMARVDVVSAMAISAELIQSRHTLALLETLRVI